MAGCCCCPGSGGAGWAEATLVKGSPGLVPLQKYCTDTEQITVERWDWRAGYTNSITTGEQLSYRAAGKNVLYWCTAGHLRGRVRSRICGLGSVLGCPVCPASSVFTERLMAE